MAKQTYNSKFMNTGYLSDSPLDTKFSSVQPLGRPTREVITSGQETSSIAKESQEFTYSDTLKLALASKEIDTSFGRKEDSIEMHIYDMQKELLYSEPNFQDYTTEGNKNIVSSIEIDPEKVLRDRRYISGQYVLQFHIHRNKIFNSSYFPFTIKEISTSRREIKSIAEDVNNRLFDEAILTFILEIESASILKNLY